MHFCESQGLEEKWTSVLLQQKSWPRTWSLVQTTFYPGCVLQRNCHVNPRSGESEGMCCKAAKLKVLSLRMFLARSVKSKRASWLDETALCTFPVSSCLLHWHSLESHYVVIGKRQSSAFPRRRQNWLSLHPYLLLQPEILCSTDLYSLQKPLLRAIILLYILVKFGAFTQGTGWIITKMNTHFKPVREISVPWQNRTGRFLAVRTPTHFRFFCDKIIACPKKNDTLNLLLGNVGDHVSSCLHVSPTPNYRWFRDNMRKRFLQHSSCGQFPSPLPTSFRKRSFSSRQQSIRQRIRENDWKRHRTFGANDSWSLSHSHSPGLVNMEGTNNVGIAAGNVHQGVLL